MAGLSAGLCFLLQALSDIVFLVVIVNVILSWLITFNIVNIHNRFVFMIYDMTDRLLQPLLGPIRRFMPNLGGLDLSPIILLLGVQLIVVMLSPYVCYAPF
ncbi:MAG: YggT family protein [Pseudomonadota bacterium]